MTNMLDALDMKVEKEGEGILVMSMPVTDKVKQPFGFLHGGASLALGETACSMGAASLIDTEQYIPLGLEMNANHISSTTGYCLCFRNSYSSRQNDTSMEY